MAVRIVGRRRSNRRYVLTAENGKDHYVPWGHYARGQVPRLYQTDRGRELKQNLPPNSVAGAINLLNKRQLDVGR